MCLCLCVAVYYAIACEVLLLGLGGACGQHVGGVGSWCIAVPPTSISPCCFPFCVIAGTRPCDRVVGVLGASVCACVAYMCAWSPA